MAEWTTTLGAASSQSSVNTTWSSAILSGHQIPADLLAAGGTAFLRTLVARNPAETASNELLRTSSTDSGTGDDVGPDLTSAWETGSHSIELNAGGLSLVLPGPNNSTNQVQDAGEVYAWRPPASYDAVRTEFVTGYPSLTQAEKDATTLTLRDFVPAAPSWTDDTGDAITGTVGTAIPSVTVPAVDVGAPAPTYAQVGTVAGVSFNTTTRALSFDEDAIEVGSGSGTIRIRATNSSGSDDWTVGYTFVAAGVQEWSTPLPAAQYSNVNFKFWEFGADAPVVDAGLTGGETRTLFRVGLADFGNLVRLLLSDSDPPGFDSGQDLSSLFETNGSLTITLPTGETATFALNGADTAEPYGWIPTDAAELAAHATLYAALSDSIGAQAGTLTLRDFVPVVPSWTDDTGDDITGTVGTAIAAVTVPAVDAGAPDPTYAQVGTVAGVSFNTTTRALSFDEDAIEVGSGSGTIRIRATNSSGSDDWTVGYTFVAANEAPSFTDNTGDAQSWTVGVAIASLTIPRAFGNPDPTYQLLSSPDGINVTLPTTGADGIITGTPTAVGSGTVWIRALNSEGSANWTVAYTTIAALAVIRTGSGERGTVSAAGVEGTGRSIIPLLLSEWSVPSGEMQVFAALIEIGVSGEDRYNEASSVGALLDGDMQLATDLTFNRIRIRSSPSRLTFNRSGSGSVETYLEAGGIIRWRHILYIQNLEWCDKPIDSGYWCDSYFWRFFQYRRHFQCRDV